MTGYIMDISRFVTESAAYTRATLLGNPSRWIVFILLGLPWMALTTLLESSRVLEGHVLHWSLIPWHEAGLLIGAGLLCNFLISGWIVRLFRNDSLPPDFARPLLLLLDGIKVQTIPLVWIVIPAVLAYIQYSIAGSSTLSLILWPPDPATLEILLLLAVQLFTIFCAVQYGLIGAIRFARTGSVRDAFSLSEIRKTTIRIGIINYYLGFGIVAAAWILFSLSLRLITFVPSAGPLLSLCFSPVPTVFCSRFVAHFCDEDQYTVGTVSDRAPWQSATTAVPGRSLAAEYLFWLAAFAVLVVLCFTPMALIAASILRYLP